MNLVNEVSALHTELEHLRAEVQTHRKDKIIRDFENQRLRASLERTLAERDYHFRRATEVKTLLDSTGAMLVRGINAFNDQGHDGQEAVVEDQRSLTHEPEPETPFHAAVAKAINGGAP